MTTKITPADERILLANGYLDDARKSLAALQVSKDLEKIMGYAIAAQANIENAQDMLENGY